MENEMKQDQILDDVAEFVGLHVSATEAQVTAMTLYAAATWGLPSFVTFGRMLFASDRPESGKTLAMMVTAALCSDPEDVSGTAYALQSVLAAAANTPEKAAPTLYCDEISDVFGRSGLNASRNPLAEVLRKGYKRGATRKWSVNRVAEEYSIFTPFLMSGLRVAVPGDIRSRCIVITMKPGRPQQYFDARESEPLAKRHGKDLSIAVRNVLGDLKEFRALDLALPHLTGRKAEVWEPLFAVALHLGGQKWLNKCAKAFAELAANESSQMVLTVRQQLIRDTVSVMDGPLSRYAAYGLVPAELLADELKRVGDELYDQLDLNGLKQLVARTMQPAIRKRRVAGLLKRGFPIDQMVVYLAQDVRDEWDRIRPDDPEDVELPGFEDPFALSDDIEEFELGDEAGVAQVAGVAGVSQQDLSKDEPQNSVLYPACENDDEEPVVITSRRRTKVQTAAGQGDDKFLLSALKG